MHFIFVSALRFGPENSLPLPYMREGIHRRPLLGRGSPPGRNLLSRLSGFGPIKTKRHGEIRASFASVRLRRSVVVVARFARPATAAGCLATFSSRDSGLFAREFVRGSFLVGGAPTFRRDCPLRLRIHRRESAGSLPTHTAGIPCLHSALSSRPANRSTASASHSAAAHASFVHPVPFVVGLVCHYPSPAANFRVCQAWAGGNPSCQRWIVHARTASGEVILMRKRQAAIFGRGPTDCLPGPDCGFLLFSHLCDAYVKRGKPLEPGQGARGDVFG
jgi:hypothetical protein